MAGNDQSNKSSRQRERLGPSIVQGTSRVSRAAGSYGAERPKGEKRSSTPLPRRSSPTDKQQSSRGRTSSRQGDKAGARKNSAPKRNGNRTASPVFGGQGAPKGTADSRVIVKVRSAWNTMEPHHQQRILGVLLLGLSLILFAALTVFHASGFSHFFFVFFGWSAYLLAAGLIAFSLAHLIEGIRQQQFIRWSLVIGLLLLWLILLVESQLLLGGMSGGVLAELLVRPLLGWPAAIGHVLLIGLFGIVTILTFRITLGDMLFVGRAIGGILPSGQKARPGKTGGPSRFLGQRPQYSRYWSGVFSKPSQEQAKARRGISEEKAEDAEFEIGDDPLNDITIHKQRVSLLPHGHRPAQSLDLEEHNASVQGVQQQPLPFHKAAKGPEKYPAQGNLELEPLAPNPLRANQAQVGARPAGSMVESTWKIPETKLLNNPEEVKLQLFGDDTTILAKTIQDTLRSFRVDAEVKQEDISIGPTVIRFGIRPTGKPEMKQDAQGKYVPVRDAGGNIVYEARTRVSRIMALQNDLALVLEAKTIRMEAPVPGRPYVGVEIPNKNSRLVTLREVLESKEYQAAKTKSKLAIALGKDVAGSVRVGDLARMPHLLIAGATGAGKSVCINTIIASILTQATPEDVRLLMIDPKMVELNMYNGVPHLLSPVVTEVEKVVPLLRNAILEMEKRYRLFSQLGVRNLDGYRKLRAEAIGRGDMALKTLPAIVIIIDELADLMMAAPEEVEGMICRLAQLARATGIHLVVATQRPSVDVITGLIKANIPTRISFMVSSAVDSRTIIDMGGAERLLGRGDMLYLPADAGRPERIQGSFLADEEAERLVGYWKQAVVYMAAGSSEAGSSFYATSAPQVVEPGWEIKEHSSDDFELDDDLLEKAEDVVREYERASISLLQRRLRIGYSRAARLIDLLEERGIIGRSETGGRSREVLDGGNGLEKRGGEGRTMADEVADIIADEKTKEEYLKRQGTMGRLPAQGYTSADGKEQHEGKK